ncbi:MAG: phosphatidylserine/phosphatidylglycerophosphate/cardiolipin synthase family protein [bacterium]|jgi:phosphatidylserine/phosphatidylglycerophosphate/cardiolipin synthase-like enzyme|nr:phosphatidylserine/phosphatidylglycerophosphate/cardiolipin synthase family protein [bacterium]
MMSDKSQRNRLGSGRTVAFRTILALLLVLALVLPVRPIFSGGDPAYLEFEDVGDGVKLAFDELSLPSRNTRVRLLTENVKSWYARWYIMQNAKVSIDTTYFILEHDVFGDAFVGLLLKKAQEGISVRLMIDARGSTFFASRFTGGQDYLQELVEAGAEVKIFNPILEGLPELPCRLKYFMSSNHDKIIIVDGQFIITGGRNIADHYFVAPSDDPTVYRDTDVIMEGEFIGRSMTEAFQEEFYSLDNYTVDEDMLGNWFSKSYHLLAAEKAMDAWMNGGQLYEPTGDYQDDPSIYNEDLVKYQSITTYEGYIPFHGDRFFPIKIMDKHSIAGDRNDITDSIVKLMDAAEKEILIQNPYVVLTDKAKAALQRANDRGVKIIIHTNSPISTDNLLTQAFFLADWFDLQVAMPNMEVWVFTGDRKLHAKVFVFDRKIATIGTYNLDSMSEQINSEVLACINSGSFAMRTALRIMDDIKDSKQYTLALSKDGRVPVELFGPATIAKGRLKLILDFLAQIKWLRALI